MYHRSPQLTDWQRQIIYGSILGGSSLIKPVTSNHHYLSMRSKGTMVINFDGKGIQLNRDAFWIYYKTRELRPLGAVNSFYCKGNYIRWHSACYPVFDEIYKLFYDNEVKIVNKEILDILRDIGLATWFMDAGKVQKNKVILKTSRFGQGGSETISQYFEEIDLHNVILCQRKKSFQVQFDEESSDKFLKVVVPCIPEFVLDV